MAKISLKNLLSAKSAESSLIRSFIEKMNATVSVGDASGKLLLGEPPADAQQRHPVMLDGETLGWVAGSGTAPIIASLIELLMQKEMEKKKIASEVLLLYQEVNMIFNFSEKLAQTIGQHSITEITLEEACRLIRSDSGLIILWNEAEGRIEVPASSGNPLFDFEKFRKHRELLLSLSRSGQSEIMSDLSPLKNAGLISGSVQSLVYAALKVNHRVMGAIILARETDEQYAAADLKFLITLALQSSSAIESALLYEKNIREAKEKEEAMRQILDVTNKFVPHEFIRSLGHRVITDVQLGDQVEKVVTVLFSDIRSYTTLAEKMTPEENFRFVSSFNERIGPIIREHNGFINQYLGDAIMAIFPGNASDALSAAIDMQRAVRELNVRRSEEGKPSITIGIGMHTGPLIMGITGDRERLDATTIADTVNTASRLEGLTSHFKVGILLSESSLQQLSDTDSFHLRHLGLVQVKGKKEATRIFECFNGSGEKELSKKLHSLPVFREGMTDYLNKSFHEATNKFYQALQIFPEDTTVKLFLGKASHYMVEGIPENWTGVEEMQVK